MIGFEASANKVAEKLLDASTIRWIYSAFCSFWALCALCPFTGIGVQEIAQGNGRALGLGESPFGLASAVFARLDIPVDWLVPLNMYLVEKGRDELFAVMAAFIGVLAVLLLGDEFELGTVRASSAWLSFATLIQLGFRWPAVIGLVICYALRTKYLLKTHRGEMAAFALLDLALSAIAVISIPLLLLLGSKKGQS